jgi:hypothetical protein
MAVKPYTWISWSDARSRMGAIWDGWSWDRDSADRSFVNTLRRLDARYFRGEARDYDGGKIPIADVAAGLTNLFYKRAEYEKTTLSSGMILSRMITPPRAVTFEISASLLGAELAWEPFRDDLIQFELPAGTKPNSDPFELPAGALNDRVRRRAYKGPLAKWMGLKNIKLLRRMHPSDIAAEYKLYCETERPQLLPLLPKRLRSMEGTIERIRADMERADPDATGKRGTAKGQ